MCECGSIKSFLMLGLGVRKKVSDRLDEMAQTGKKSYDEHGGVVKETLEMAEDGREKFREGCMSVLHNVLKKCDIPTDSEVESLRKEVKALKKKLKTSEETKEDKKKHKA